MSKKLLSGITLIELMERRFTSAVLFLGVLILGNAAPLTKALSYSGTATVKVNLLPVYTDTSAMSGILKFLKKGDVVEVQDETINSEVRWCSVKESGQKMMVGFVNCEALDFSTPSRQSMWEIKLPPPPMKTEERQPQARLVPSTPSKVTEPIPQLGPLLQAVWNEDIPRIRDLLGKGADPNAQTSCGTRPLLVAAKKKSPDIIKILIENGAKVEGRDRNGLTPLMSAASVGQTRSVEVLIDAGADLNAKDNKGFTAIMWATMKAFPEVVEILFSSGADLNVKTTEGLTAKRLSQRIIADLKRAPGEGEKPDKEVASRLTRHERVFQMLESAGRE